MVRKKNRIFYNFFYVLSLTYANMMSINPIRLNIIEILHYWRNLFDNVNDRRDSQTAVMFYTKIYRSSIGSRNLP